MHPQRKASDEGADERGVARGQLREEQALIAGSMWLYLGFIGAAAFGGGLILTLDDETSGILTWALIVAGGTLAPVCWLRARTVFGRATRALSRSANAGSAAASGLAPLRRHVRESVGHAWTDVVAGSRPQQQRQPTR